jgi:predicted enzyme related to lactoylglutathione lyase
MDVLFAGISVGEFEGAAKWYERLLGRPADIVAHDTQVMWRIAGQAWLYIVAEPARAGYAVAGIAVSDLDETLAQIERRGLAPQSTETVGDAGRKASFVDPDGNTISFLQVVGGERLSRSASSSSRPPSQWSRHGPSCRATWQHAAEARRSRVTRGLSRDSWRRRQPVCAKSRRAGRRPRID